jgi:hypothetical protein
MGCIKDTTTVLSFSSAALGAQRACVAKEDSLTMAATRWASLLYPKIRFAELALTFV